MFTGIIETLGSVKNIVKEQENVHLTIKSDITNALKIDQSVAHNGVCLTVVDIKNDEYTVTAIKETLDKSNIGKLKLDHIVNLERAMKLGDRLDGHIVQGHVDETGVCIGIKDENGSTLCTFKYISNQNNITIEKGSITVNGVSLTVVNSKKDEFSVAIIPYTWQHTTFKTLQINDVVNLEFDVIGKYVARLTAYNN
ncbi:riboflavin synthase [Polaribacter litorisediminis]|uniref:riboflavin synthase n=1 Tax=Polaribacter litorisediminis TaxID=1908341 RepID=UPI001CBB1D83|nr:riboflavin synthase [Polaribacter litorisediminis]UAM98122.1 riboflavin synthase [Polaribacter litorisediminis]